MGIIPSGCSVGPNQAAPGGRYWKSLPQAATNGSTHFCRQSEGEPEWRDYLSRRVVEPRGIGKIDTYCRESWSFFCDYENRRFLLVIWIVFFLFTWDEWTLYQVTTLWAESSGIDRSGGGAKIWVSTNLLRKPKPTAQIVSSGDQTDDNMQAGVAWPTEWAGG